MRRARLISTAVLAGLLAACGSSSQDEAAKPASGTRSDGQGDTVFKDVVGTQDRARAVEAAAAQHQLELQRTLEQAEGK